MSKVLRSAFSERVRVQTHPDGDSLTEQCFKDDCDVNYIMKRFSAIGQAPKFAKQQLQFGDFSDVKTYQEAIQLSIDAENEFMRLPADLRFRFGNDAGNFIQWFDDETNFDECVKLGLKAPKPVSTEVKSSVGDGAV